MDAGTSSGKAQAPGQASPPWLNSRVALSLAFLGIFGTAVAIAALSYPSGAREMPLIIGGLGAALSLLQFLTEIRESHRKAEEKVNLRKDLPVYAWVWSFVIVIALFGFMVAAPPALFAYLKFRSKERWAMSVGLAIAVWVLLWGLFEQLLGVTLWEGLLTPGIVDWLLPS
jgi:hypothetical protein